MTVHNLIRQSHRWLSIAFTLAVVANFVVLGLGIEAMWLGMVALLPLFLLLFTGLYLFVVPYLPRRGAAPEPR